MIRPATHADIPRLVELGQMLHGMSSYASLQFDAEKVAELLGSLIDGAGVVFVSERGGVVTGGLAGGISEHWFSRDRVAFDHSIFVDPQARNGVTASKLVLAFVEWAKHRGAREVRLGITTGLHVEQTARFYRWLGFEDAGQLFRMEV